MKIIIYTCIVALALAKPSQLPPGGCPYQGQPAASPSVSAHTKISSPVVAPSGASPIRGPISISSGSQSNALSSGGPPSGIVPSVAKQACGDTTQAVANQVKVLKDERVSGEDGSYSFDIEAENGITFSEAGTPNAVANGSLTQQGKYSYPIPGSGKTFSLNYVANENGFQPASPFLPVAPESPHPLPQFVLDQIAQAKIEDAQGLTGDDGTDENDPIPLEQSNSGGSGPAYPPLSSGPYQSNIPSSIGSSQSSITSAAGSNLSNIPSSIGSSQSSIPSAPGSNLFNILPPVCPNQVSNPSAAAPSSSYLSPAAGPIVSYGTPSGGYGK